MVMVAIIVLVTVMVWALGMVAYRISVGVMVWVLVRIIATVAIRDWRTMSGGSYNYAYERIESLAREIRENSSCFGSPPHLRRAFKFHLLKVAEAARAIEWNDSADGDNQEDQKILACIGPTGDLDAAISDAKKVEKELVAAIERALGASRRELI